MEGVKADSGAGLYRLAAAWCDHSIPFLKGSRFFPSWFGLTRQDKPLVLPVEEQRQAEAQ
jgi:hypothetical protein